MQDESLRQVNLEHEEKVKSFVTLSEERLQDHQSAVAEIKEDLKKEMKLRRDSESLLLEAKRTITDKEFQRAQLQRERDSSQGE